jgi:hypothetical protein
MWTKNRIVAVSLHTVGVVQGRPNYGPSVGRTCGSRVGIFTGVAAVKIDGAFGAPTSSYHGFGQLGEAPGTLGRLINPFPGLNN